MVLAGGTGGAKLARGMLDVVGEAELVVVANPGDDVEIYGAYVAPDADLISFWLADLIDERGWGLAGDTFAVMDGLRALGREVWFNLGDRDLAIGLERARRLAAGERLTAAHAAICRSLGVPGRVLPASDRPVRTRVMSSGRWWALQEFMIHGARAGAAVDDVDFRGARAARPSPEVLAALRRARAIVIGPSNPIISIGPILAIPGLREAIAASPAPKVAVSPVVGGQIVKGPTAAFMAWAGRPLSGTGVASLYAGLIDGMVCDDELEELPHLRTGLLLDTPEARRELAGRALAFARGLAR